MDKLKPEFSILMRLGGFEIQYRIPVENSTARAHKVAAARGFRLMASIVKDPEQRMALEDRAKDLLAQASRELSRNEASFMEEIDKGFILQVMEEQVRTDPKRPGYHYAVTPLRQVDVASALGPVTVPPKKLSQKTKSTVQQNGKPHATPQVASTPKSAGEHDYPESKKHGTAEETSEQDETNGTSDLGNPEETLNLGSTRETTVQQDEEDTQDEVEDDVPPPPIIITPEDPNDMSEQGIHEETQDDVPGDHEGTSDHVAPLELTPEEQEELLKVERELDAASTGAPSETGFSEEPEEESQEVLARRAATKAKFLSESGEHSIVKPAEVSQGVTADNKTAKTHLSEKMPDDTSGDKFFGEKITLKQYRCIRWRLKNQRAVSDTESKAALHYISNLFASAKDTSQPSQLPDSLPDSAIGRFYVDWNDEYSVVRKYLTKATAKRVIEKLMRGDANSNATKKVDPVEGTVEESGEEPLKRDED